MREFVSQAAGLLWLAVLSAAHQRLTRLPNSEPEQRFSLLPLQAAKLSNGESRERDRASPIGFRRLEPDTCFGLFQAFRHAQHSTVEVNIFPAERQNLTAPHPCCEGKQHWPVDVHMPDRVQKASRLFHGESCDLLSLDLRKSLIERICWIAGQQLLFDRAGEGGPKDDVNIATCER